MLDYASESESDVEPATYSSVWHDAHADSSDDESIDSEQEDVLKYVYRKYKYLISIEHVRQCFVLFFPLNTETVPFKNVYKKPNGNLDLVIIL